MSVAALVHFAQQRSYQVQLRMWRVGGLWYADAKVLDASGAEVCHVKESNAFTPGLLDQVATDATSRLLQFQERRPSVL